MQIPNDQVVLKKVVGKLNGKKVSYVRLKGGWHLITKEDGSVVGAGPHGLVARHIAQKYEPSIEWTELSKSEHLDAAVLEPLLPKYEEITQRLQALQKSKE